MTIEVTAGWWLLPLAVTIVAAIWAMKVDTDEAGAYGGGALHNLMVYMAAAIVTLVAWLVWAVLT